MALLLSNFATILLLLFNPMLQDRPKIESDSNSPKELRSGEQPTDGEPVTESDILGVRQRMSEEDHAAGEIETLLAKTESHVKRAKSLQASRRNTESVLSSLEAQVQKYQQDSPGTPVTVETARSMSIEELQQIVKAKTDLVAEANHQSEQAAAMISQRGTARQQVLNRLASLEAALHEQRMERTATDADSGLLAEAHRLEIRSHIQSLILETAALEAEKRLIEEEDRHDLLRVKVEFYRRRVAIEQKNLEILQKFLDDKRQELATETTIQTRLKQFGSDPQLKTSYDINVHLAEDNQAITERLSVITQLASDTAQELVAWRRNYADAVSRVRLVGLTDSVGAMLRSDKERLPNPAQIRLNQQRIENELDLTQLNIFELTKQINRLAAKTIEEEIQAEGADDLQSLPIEELTRQRSELLSTLLKSNQQLSEKLMEVESAQVRLVELSQTYRDFINERILWIRSNDGLWNSLKIDDTDWVPLGLEFWQTAMARLMADWREQPMLYLLAALMFLFLLMAKPRLRRAVDQFGEIAARGSCTTFWPTAKSIVASSIVAATIPMLVLFLGWRLMSGALQANGHSDWGTSLGRAIVAASLFALPVEMLRRFCRPAGLAHKHFNWTDESVTTLRNHLNWFNWPASLIVFGVSLFYYMDSHHQNDLIERLIFLVGMALLGVISYRCFNPNLGMFRSVLKRHPNSWASQLSILWFPLLLLIPVALGVLAAVGHYYTALNLAVCVYFTFVFGLMVQTLRALLDRFVLVRRRVAHIELAKRQRESIRKTNQDQLSSPEDAGEVVAALGRRATDAELLQDFDVTENVNQSRQLIGLGMLIIWLFGLWVIWTDVLPALKALDNYPIWPPGATADRERSTSKGSEGNLVGERIASSPTSIVGPSGEFQREANEPTGPPSDATVITIRNLLMSLLILALTFVFGRNLPGLIEMTFLNRLPVEPSVRYASKALLSYLIVVLGIVLALRSIHVGWNQVQWLIAALTFGLAFGLQEIFANFVAGVILLFERPIRIGDVVTVDDVSGVVTKIRTRATTISNWDRKDYVIPNKEFITGRVLNWTLSGNVNRIVIEVGLAYGSDVSAAKEILYDICHNHPRILKEPPTNITFERFGDSSLILTIRTFVPDVDSRLPVIDHLHTAIHQEFQDAGIEIAFPQNDLHIRSVDQTVLESIRRSRPPQQGSGHPTRENPG